MMNGDRFKDLLTQAINISEGSTPAREDILDLEPENVHIALPNNGNILAFEPEPVEQLNSNTIKVLSEKRRGSPREKSDHADSVVTVQANEDIKIEEFLKDFKFSKEPKKKYQRNELNILKTRDLDSLVQGLGKILYDIGGSSTQKKIAELKEIVIKYLETGEKTDHPVFTNQKIVDKLDQFSIIYKYRQDRINRKITSERIREEGLGHTRKTQPRVVISDASDTESLSSIKTYLQKGPSARSSRPVFYDSDPKRDVFENIVSLAEQNREIERQRVHDEIINNAENINDLFEIASEYLNLNANEKEDFGDTICQYIYHNKDFINLEQKAKLGQNFFAKLDEFKKILKDEIDKVLTINNWPELSKLLEWKVIPDLFVYGEDVGTDLIKKFNELVDLEDDQIYRFHNFWGRYFPTNIRDHIILTRKIHVERETYMTTKVAVPDMESVNEKTEINSEVLLNSYLTRLANSYNRDDEFRRINEDISIKYQDKIITSEQYQYLTTELRNALLHADSGHDNGEMPPVAQVTTTPSIEKKEVPEFEECIDRYLSDEDIKQCRIEKGKGNWKKFLQAFRNGVVRVLIANNINRVTYKGLTYDLRREKVLGIEQLAWKVYKFKS